MVSSIYFAQVHFAGTILLSYDFWDEFKFVELVNSMRQMDDPFFQFIM